MYLVEALPALVLALLIPFVMPDKPEAATFLTEPERDWLARTLERERVARDVQGAGGHHLLAALLSPQILLLALTYYGLTNLNGAISTFLPLILKSFGLTNTGAGFVAAVPYAFGALGMILLGRFADQPGRRGAALYWALGISLVGLLVAGIANDPATKLVALCFGAIGVFGCMPVFWGLPTGLLSGTVAAGGLALINSLGNLSSVVNPWVIGLIRDNTGSYDGGLFWLAAMAVLSIVTVTIVFQLWGRPERIAPVSEH